MAVLAAEPMGQRHGIALYSAQTTFGTAVTPATAIGIATLRWNAISDPQYFTGPGSMDPIHMRPGSAIVEWSLDVEALQTSAKTLLLKVQRTVDDVCPLLTLGLGVADDTPTTPVVAIDQIRDCKVERVTLTADASGGHGPLRASMSGVGTFMTRLTAGAAALLTTTPWMTQDLILTRAAAAFESRSLTMEIANTISRDYVLAGAAKADAPRSPSYLTEHGREFTGSVTRYAEMTESMLAAALTEAALVATFTNPVDSATLVATYANLAFGNAEQSIGADGRFFNYSFKARALTLA